MLPMLNAYYLLEESTRCVRRGETACAILEEVLSKAAALGVRVLRVAGFNDDPAKIGDSTLQVAPLRYDDVAWRGFDLLLQRTAAHGLQLILTLGNYWDAYGGARQYVAWAGLPRPQTGDARFFTDANVRAHCKAHIELLLQRVNLLDGSRYGEHPAVFAWELLNEPRGDGLDKEGKLMRAWIDDLGAAVKRWAPGQWLGTGEEGFDIGWQGYDSHFWQRTVGVRWLFRQPSSFRANVASPFVDYGSVHLYPEAWGVRPELRLEVGRRWISEHAAIAREAGKPLLVGEFGLRNGGDLALPERRHAYREWLRCARAVGSIGAAPWLFANDSRPEEWDAYTFYHRSGTAAADLANRYADLIAEAAGAEGAADD